jgi:predicted Fe-S protein YdhL (DUF1289 family)
MVGGSRAQPNPRTSRTYIMLSRLQLEFVFSGSVQTDCTNRKVGLEMINEGIDVQSPCVRNCCLNDDDICLGCFRSLEEITMWGAANNQERSIVLNNALQRMNQIGSDLLP